MSENEMDKKNEINNNEENRYNYDNTNLNIKINKIEKIIHQKWK
jgi:hypothetical protein